MKKLISLVFILSLTACSFWHSEEDYQNAISSEINLNSETVFTISPGMSSRSIGSKLEKEGIINEGWAFEEYVKRENLAAKLQAGDYTLRPGATISDLAETFLIARKDEVRITIPEGYRLTQIDELFAEKGLTSPGDILALKDNNFNFEITKDIPKGVDLEGYLFPDTYFFETEKTSAKEILEKLIGTMNTKFTPEMLAEIKRQDKTLHEVLTVASLIERESFADDERPVISGIIWNRLDIGMTLGIDATIQYAVSDGWEQNLTYDDLQIESPYNTRTKAGLPPGPICSPGIESIKAAIYPEETDYLYYLHDANGQIYYAATNSEHNENRALYLK